MPNSPVEENPHAIPTAPAPNTLGRVHLPTILPLGVVLVFTLAAGIGWRDLHVRSDLLQRDLETLRAAQTTALAEGKAKDAALDATITAMRDQAFGRQETLLTRLTRIETILDRLDRQNGPPRP
jgi:hypothetical protein